MNCGHFSIAAMLAVSMLAHGQAIGSEKGQESPSSSSTPSDPVSSSAPAASTDTYIIGASDSLNVTVWKETSLSGDLLVRPDGMISVPLLGDVQAAGLTPLQLATEVETKLKKYIQSPNVTVEIRQIHSKVVYMLGEVGKKGPIDLTPGMTLLQAISSAGGLTDYANSKKIYILRASSGKQEKIPAHYKEALKGDSALNLVLQPGDTIVVP
jgi:polysaccharide export outer membrane protein